jgi:hypothetical protein
MDCVEPRSLWLGAGSRHAVTRTNGNTNRHMTGAGRACLMSSSMPKELLLNTGGLVEFCVNE